MQCHPTKTWKEFKLLFDYIFGPLTGFNPPSSKFKWQLSLGKYDQTIRNFGAALGWKCKPPPSPFFPQALGKIPVPFDRGFIIFGMVVGFTIFRGWFFGEKIGFLLCRANLFFGTASRIAKKLIILVYHTQLMQVLNFHDGDYVVSILNTLRGVSANAGIGAVVPYHW